MDSKLLWQGHPILHPDHTHGLERRAALLEFHHGLPRQEAEAQALKEYRAQHHAIAAAHHLQGLKAAHAIGSTEAAKRHHAMYQAHVKNMGVDPNGPPPPEVSQHLDGNAGRVYGFQNHGADIFLDQGESMAKSEDKEWDYSHILSPEHREAGYSIKIVHNPGKRDGLMRAHLMHNGKTVAYNTRYPNVPDSRHDAVASPVGPIQVEGQRFSTAEEPAYHHAEGPLGGYLVQALASHARTIKGSQNWLGGGSAPQAKPLMNHRKDEENLKKKN